MLRLQILPKDRFDSESEKFVVTPGVELTLQHTLVSISKWESYWKVSFLDTEEKSDEMVLDYISKMSETPVDPEILLYLSNEEIGAVVEYISDPMTATTFGKSFNRAMKTEIVTSELIYYWMTALQIPMACENWHLNRLITLIRIAAIKNNPDKQPTLSRSELLSRHREMNAQMRAKYNSKG